VAEKHYNWVIGGPLPLLHRHSAVKHALLRDYLVDYFLTLIADPRQDHIKLTIVDGFCGGGRYVDDSGKEVPGSPIIILEAIKEAKARIIHTQRRIKPLNIDVELICIDQNLQALKHLKWVFEQEGYGEKIRSEQIHLLHGQFETFSEDVIKRAEDRSRRSGKAVFVLDQYGYAKVSLPILQAIFTHLAKAEVILTFNVDSLINYLNDRNLANFEGKTGFEGALTAHDMDNLYRGPGWRRQIQSKLYGRITSGSGARHFTPFFIRPAKGHGDFWLLHLSQHSKARDVMAATHWKHNNYFVHYAHAGLDMFGVGYAAVLDEEGKPQAAFEFDDLAATQSHFAMLEEIPRLLEKKREGIPFEDFFTERCNSTPATRSMIEDAALALVQEKQVEVIGLNGKKRNVRAAIQDNDIIRLPAQRPIVFL
jgi:three-Cys-motif partner protein